MKNIRKFFDWQVWVVLTALLVFISPDRIRAEKEGVKEISEPHKLINLRKDYERTIEGVEIPIQDLYLKHLNKLLDRFTSQQKLDEAIAVRKEIRKITELRKSNGSNFTSAGKSTSETAKTPTKSDFKKWLEEHEIFWGSGTGREITVQFDGSMMKVLVNGARPASYKYNLVSPSAFEVNWGGDDNTFTRAENKRSFTRVMKQSGNEYEAQVRKRSK